jgi:hypothetical protein
MAKSSNPFFKKISKVLKSQDRIKSYSTVAFLGGFEFSDESYETCKKLISDNKLKEAINVASYNTQADNIEIYYFEDIKSEKYYLLLLYDPAELLISETIMDIIEYNKVDLSGLKHEVIYLES